MTKLKEHDSVATRLTQILMKFNNGESISTKELAEEFNVQVRTIQKDLTQRLSFLPIEKKGTRYFLADYVLGKLSLKDIKSFATFSGIRELYPKLSDNLIVDILNQKTNKALLVKGHNYEDLTHLIDEFNTIGTAIVSYKKISFMYKNKKRFVHPYRLINTHGIWYVVTTEDDVLKTFTFSQVKQLRLMEEHFDVDKDIVRQIDEGSAWITQNPIKIVLEIDASVSKYFLRRELLPKQKIIASDEQLIVLSTIVDYEEEVLNTVRYWIPHIRIRSPRELQKKLEEGLHNYLQNTSTF